MIGRFRDRFGLNTDASSGTLCSVMVYEVTNKKTNEQINWNNNNSWCAESNTKADLKIARFLSLTADHGTLLFWCFVPLEINTATPSCIIDMHALRTNNRERKWQHQLACFVLLVKVKISDKQWLSYARYFFAWALKLKQQNEKIDNNDGQDSESSRKMKSRKASSFWLVK